MFPSLQPIHPHATLHPRHLSFPDLLAERARSNQRLVRALAISNTFVSEKPDVHKQFVSQARRLLNNAQQRGWSAFQSIAVEAIQWYDKEPGTSESGRPFSSLVQSTTLVVVLAGLLEVDNPIDSYSHADIALVANNITTLWTLSKRPGPIPSSFLDDLNSSLRLLVPDDNTFPQPLNFVVPAWETLWRVVATTVAYAQRDPLILKEFENFHAHPSDERFHNSEFRVKGVVYEALRLHPPSKHIARVRCRTWCPPFITRVIGKVYATMVYERKVADIEAMLRCEMWGTDGEVFKPERHHQSMISPEQTEALTFVFGHGPLRCVAASWAPMAAAVISAAIIDHLHRESYTLEQGRCIGGREGWSGWKLRRNGI
ncbi:hypothetical protein BYT27DRAFT_7235717 [Phlegmacium glaucopus]|nr:hypothetical protein BYT27DRAFT_7235717 [Phlegmacium glaucopus]